MSFFPDRVLPARISSLVCSSNLLSPTWRGDDNTTVADNFNVTVAKSQDAFSLAGELNSFVGWGSFDYNNISMPACNSSYYNGDWKVSLLEVPGEDWWSTKGWKGFTLPILNVTFDTQTADFALNGDFAANPFLRSNDTDYNGGTAGELGPAIQGTIGFTFKGVLDAYHSDVLNTNTSSPIWLRTVGFGNNTLNIGNSNSAAGQLGPSQWAMTVIMAFSVFILFH